jgi:repressor LexA
VRGENMGDKKELTHKQKRVLDFIRRRIGERMPPTIREIAGELGFSSTGTVRDYLKALEEKGYLKRSAKRSRAIELLKDSLNKFRIPVIGVIPAGRPTMAYEDIQGYVDVDDLFLGRLSQNDVFALKVKGQSMIDAGIVDGDIVIIKKQNIAHHGDIVAAILSGNEEVTLKRFRHHAGKKPYLEAANKDYPPIYEEFAILGKLITVIRKY